MNILHHKTAESHRDFTSRAGLMAPATLIERLGPGKIVDRMMPAPGSNRATGPLAQMVLNFRSLLQGKSRYAAKISDKYL